MNVNGNDNNNINGGNDDMNISPARSPYIQPKFNNTSIMNLIKKLFFFLLIEKINFI